jgi:hypothetical protein
VTLWHTSERFCGEVAVLQSEKSIRSSERRMLALHMSPLPSRACMVTSCCRHRCTTWGLLQAIHMAPSCLGATFATGTRMRGTTCTT